jgi:NADPH2:quinone reductase
MRALICNALTGLESLSVETLPDPVPAPDEVVVAVSHCGLNFFDTLIIRGQYQFKPEPPFSPGGELAGTIAALGSRVAGFAVGDRVAAYVTYGACRSHVAVPANRIVRIPNGVSDADAAGLLVTYGTSLHALKDRGALQAGETLVVLGAAGGAGLAAVKLGKLLGAKVIACASSADKLALAQASGADALLDYTQENLRDGLKRLTDGQGADVIYDPVGGGLAELALRAIAWKGRFLVIGFASGTIPKIPLNLTLLKGCDIRGVFWGAFAEKEPEANAANNAQLLRWTAEGKIRDEADEIVSLDQAKEAIARIAARQAKGKILIRM